MAKIIIHPFSLKFSDAKFEHQFSLYKQEAQVSKFRYIVFSISAISIHASFSGKPWAEMTFVKEGIVAIANFVFFALIYKITTKWLLKHLEAVVTFIILLVVVIPSELPKSNWSRIIYFSCGSLTQLFSSFFLLYHIPFKKNIFNLTFSTLYPVWRFASTKEMDDSFYYPNNTAILNLTVLLALNYYTEKQYRLSFYAQYSYQISLENFKQVMKNVIPHGTIIVRNGEIVFTNEACKKLFTTGDKGNRSYDENFLESIAVERENNAGGGNFNNEDLAKRKMESVFGVIQEFEQKNTNTSQNIHELNCDKFLSLSGHYSRIISPSIDKDKAPEKRKKEVPLDLLIGKLIWENEGAYMVMASNISAKKRVRFLKELGKYKDCLLATVSHDLRTPLNGVLGILQILLETQSEKMQRKLLQICLRSANLLLFMINDILDFSQISNGKLRLNINKADGLSFLNDIVKIIKFQARKKGISFIFKDRVGSLQDWDLLTDVNRVKQVLLNLLGNALKFTTAGSITLELYLDELNNRKAVILQVSDTGIGIKEEDIPKLFKLFGKLEQSSKEINAGGVGLGLAISQNLVKMLCGNEAGGEIKVKSEYGVGSEFRFPLFLSEKNESDLQDGSLSEEVPDEYDLDSSSSEERKSRKSKLSTAKTDKPSAVRADFSVRDNSQVNILIVDDDPINILVASKYVEGYGGYCYETAFNGQSALEKLLQYKNKGLIFHIVLMDCNMPVMDGFEASKKIRELVRSEQLNNLIIIALTANTTEEDKNLCLLSGMDYFMTKPVEKAGLELKLKSLASAIKRS